MRGMELGLKEAAALLGCSEAAVVRLVYHDRLVAEYSGESLRVPLTSIVRFVGADAEHAAVRGMRNVLGNKDAWHRVFGSDPQLSSVGGFDAFPHGPVGQSLRRAIAISEIRGA